MYQRHGPWGIPLYIVAHEVLLVCSLVWCVIHTGARWTWGHLVLCMMYTCGYNGACFHGDLWPSVSSLHKLTLWHVLALTIVLPAPNSTPLINKSVYSRLCVLPHTFIGWCPHHLTPGIIHAHQCSLNRMQSEVVLTSSIDLNGA